MASFIVRNGLLATAKLPDTQILLIGRSSLLKKSKMNTVLTGKLEGVKESIYNTALEELNDKGGSVPLHFNYAKVNIIYKFFQ